MVAPPLALSGSSREKSSLQAKCSRQSSRRGSNRRTSVPAQRITTSGEIVLQAIAVGAGCCQILGSVKAFTDLSGDGAAASRSWDDVIDLELPMRDVAVLTAIAGPSLDRFLFAVRKSHALPYDEPDRC